MLHLPPLKWSWTHLSVLKILRKRLANVCIWLSQDVPSTCLSFGLQPVQPAANDDKFCFSWAPAPESSGSSSPLSFANISCKSPQNQSFQAHAPFTWAQEFGDSVKGMKSKLINDLVPSCPSGACSARIEKVGHYLFTEKFFGDFSQFLYSVWKLSRFCLFLGLSQELVRDFSECNFDIASCPTFQLPRTVHRVMESVSKTSEFPLKLCSHCNFVIKALKFQQIGHQNCKFKSAWGPHNLQYFSICHCLYSQGMPKQSTAHKDHNGLNQDRRLSPTTCSRRYIHKWGSVSGHPTLVCVCKESYCGFPCVPSKSYMF